jgi:hypothetical protein
VAWTGHALNRTERGNPHLHRSAGCPGGEFGQQRPDGITKQLTIGFAALVEGPYCGIDGRPI